MNVRGDFLGSPHSTNTTALICKSRYENPQKDISWRKGQHKKTPSDITSDSQLNSNFPQRWPPASLTFNNYLHLFLYLYITRLTINNNAPHLKFTKEPKQKSHLGTASNEIRLKFMINEMILILIL